MKRVAIALLAAVLLGGAGLVIARTGAGADEPVPIIEIVARPFTATVKARGELKSKSTVTVSAGRAHQPMTVSWLAPEGTEVEPGDVVVEFESHEARDQLATAAAEMRKIEEEIKKHHVQVGATRSDLQAEATRARISVDKARFKAELDDGVVPRVELEEARMDLRLADMDLGRVERTITAQAPKDGAALALLEIRLEKARNQYQMAETNLDATKVKAEVPGMVAYKMTWKAGNLAKVAPGDTIWPGRPVVDLVDLAQLELVAQVREEDAVRVAAGQKVVVRLPALAGGPLTGEVSQVAKVAQQTDRTSPLKYVEVKVELDETDQTLRAGLTGSAEIEVTVEPEALSVPREAVSEDDDGPYLYVDSGAESVLRRVELGVQSDAEVVVTAGLSPGDRVYARDPTKSKEEIEAERLARQKEARKNRKSTGGRSGGVFIRF